MADGINDNFDLLDTIRSKLKQLDKDIEKAKKNLNYTKITDLSKEKLKKKTDLALIKTKNKHMQRLKHYVKDRILEDADLVFSTLFSAGTKELLNKQFDYVIVEEASQITEMTSLIPFQFKAVNVILVGDHKQLSPTVFSASASDCKYDRSLFERLMLGGTKVDMLLIQYRMTQEMCSFPSMYFYDSRLINFDDLNSRQKPGWVPDCKLILFNLMDSFENTDSNDENGFYNQTEAGFITNIYKNLLLNYRFKLNVGVMAPYKRQVTQVKESLDQCVDKT